jgi:uncharacterized membrane protein
MPLHPKIVHLPIALAVLMPLLSLGLLAAWWRGWLPRRAWWIAVFLQGALLAGGLAAARSGEADEERAERVVDEAAIEAHEEAAGIFNVAAAGVLALGLLAGLIRHERSAQALASAAFAGTLAVLLAGFRVGDAGGRLVYEHGAAAAFASPPSAAAGRMEHDDDD